MAESTFEKRSWRPRPAGVALAQVTKAAFRKRGFTRREILTQWPSIVGDLMARYSCPERLQFGRDRNEGATLVVRAGSGFATELQHLHPIVLDRINTFFGYQAVARITIIQGPLPIPTTAERRALRNITPEEDACVADQVSGTRNPDLAEALRALGRTLTVKN
jgi:hypothetical protein